MLDDDQIYLLKHLNLRLVNQGLFVVPLNAEKRYYYLLSSTLATFVIAQRCHQLFQVFVTGSVGVSMITKILL